MNRPIAAVLAGALLAVAATPVIAASPAASGVPAVSPHTDDISGARSVCEEKGGQIQVREAMFGTNDDPGTWLDLGRSIELCRFQADDGSRIYVDTLTLAAPGPTLASVAYLSQVQMADYDPNRGDPATAYCEDLAASSAYGGGAAGGGWVDSTDPDDPIIAMCVFPDGSMIDEWGLAYHSNGVIRGIDLATAFVYEPDGDLPPIFGD